MEKNSMLANSIRPTKLEDVIGQEHLVGNNGIISKMLEKNKLLSMILYGAAGVGKTTIARIIVNTSKSDFLELNATNITKKDLENAITRSRLSSNFILIIDEIHRLNKDKQDILLPVVESGLITLIGLTNSNPYHSVNKALRSRVILLEVKGISIEDMKMFLEKIIDETELKDIEEKQQIISKIASVSNMDIRHAINQLELLTIIYEKDQPIDKLLENLNINVKIDKNEDYYYDTISSLQKSVRGSDVNAALFYLAILVLAQDLDIIERRLSIMAYEDVGLANPEVVDRVLNALKVARMVGFPEAKIPLAFCVVDLALSSKSNKAYVALDKAIELASSINFSFNDYMKQTPMNIKDKLNYYAIPYENKHLIQYLPNEIKNKKFYEPNNKSNYEKHLKTINDYLNKIDRSSDLEELKKKLNIK
ncbi:AAA family ATPase [Mycoplasma sp. P36-A1]|uniref:AAA family ATPase n=1 Tax=Mycoplasma sp. P36-A1 TaxID=3252900 RepID=UPI003C3048C0